MRKLRIYPESKEPFVPMALRPAREWKDAVCQETKHLSTGEALRCIHEQAGEIVRRLNLRVPAFPETGVEAEAKLAETPPPYGGKQP